MQAKRINAKARFNDFFKAEASGGILMLLAALLAMIIANSAVSSWYHAFISTPIGFSVGELSISEPLDAWVKDGLMVLFFLLVGMELKREMLEGVLYDKKQILLPLCAALGGMLMPALVFMLINYSIPAHWNGWAIPSATDIAFAVCVLMLAGKNIPPAMKIFLLAIAIFDDLGAILIIALFYNSTLALIPLCMAGAMLGTLFLMNRTNVMAIPAYLIVGVALCCSLQLGGIHATIGGVLVGMAMPLRNPESKDYSPLNACMHGLHPWVSFFILPLFAFTAAGINLSDVTLHSLTNPLTLGVALGLFLGKQLGIFSVVWIMVKAGFACLPTGSNWRHIYGVSLVAGVGFTMSLFIGMLAFDEAILQNYLKIGVIMGSLLATFFGWLVLRYRGNAKYMPM